MSASRRKSRSSRRTPAESPPEELEALEPLEELEELEELPELEAEPELEPEDTRVRIKTTGDAGELGDVLWAITLKKVAKDDVVDALAPSLRNLAVTSGAAVRWQRLVVRFEGETLIPSAVKALISETLAPASPLSITVQRGYGNEVVLEQERPRVEVRTTMGEAGHLQVEMDTADVPFADLGAALEGPLGELAAEASGRSLDVRLTAPADAALRDRLRAELGAAGARRLTVDEVLLLDRDLEGRVAVRRAADPTAIDLTLGTSESELVDALDLSLPHLDLEDGEVEIAILDRPPTPTERATLAAAFGGRGVRRLVLTHDKRDDLVLPALLHGERKGTKLEIQIRPDRRDPAAVRAAFQAEVSALAGVIQGAAVTLAWPAGMELDDDLEQDCLAAVTAHSPTAVAYTFGGKDREPALPLPLAFHTDSGGDVVVDLDTESGKPAEIVRAAQRRLRASRDELGGKRIVLHVQGGAAVSRTLRRTLRDEFEALGATAVEVIDHGESDFLLPRVLELAIHGPEVEATLTPGPRNSEQTLASLRTELSETKLPKDAVVTLRGGVDAAGAAVAFAKAGASTVRLADGTRLHPPVFAAQIDGAEWHLEAGEPASDEAAALAVREVTALLSQHGDAPATVTIVWPNASPDDAAVAQTVDLFRTAACEAVYFDDGGGLPLQVHPESQPEPAPEPQPASGAEAATEAATGAGETASAADELEELPLLEEADGTPAPAAASPATPAPEIALPAAGAAPLVQSLGTRSEGPHPLTMLALSWSGDDVDAAAAADALARRAGAVQNHRVLLVPVQDGVQVDAGRYPAVVHAAHRALGASAGALLVYRTARGRADHFAVVASRLDTLPRGARLRDPRTPSGPDNLSSPL